MKTPIPLLAVVVIVLLGAMDTNLFGSMISPASAFIPLDVGGLARGAIGAIRGIKQGIRQHIRRRMCEKARQGRIYMEPCEEQGGGGGGGGYPQNQQQQPEEVVIEEYERPNRRPKHNRHHNKPVVKEEVIVEEYQPSGGGGGGYGRPPKKNQHVIVEETSYEAQPSNNRGSYGRPPHRPRPKPREEVVIVEEEPHRVKPETVVKEMEDEGDNFHDKTEEDRRPPARKPNLPGRRPGDKQGRQQQQRPPQGKPAPGTPCQTTEGHRGLCMPAAYCFSQYSNIEDYRANRCELPAGSGICCPQEETEVDVFG